MLLRICKNLTELTPPQLQLPGFRSITCASGRNTSGYLSWIFHFRRQNRSEQHHLRRPVFHAALCEDYSTGTQHMHIVMCQILTLIGYVSEVYCAPASKSIFRRWRALQSSLDGSPRARSQFELRGHGSMISTIGYSVDKTGGGIILSSSKQAR